MLPKSMRDAMEKCRRDMEKNSHKYDKNLAKKYNPSSSENNSELNLIRYLLNERNKFIQR